MKELWNKKNHPSTILSRRDFVVGSMAVGFGATGLAHADENNLVDQELFGNDNAKSGRTIVDDLGRTVTLPNKVERIAIGRPNAQAFILSICPNKLVALAYAPEGPELLGVPEGCPFAGPLIGRREEDIEEILEKYEPDLIVDVGYYNKKVHQRIEKLLEVINIPFVSFELSLQNIPHIFKNFARVLDESRANALAKYASDVISKSSSKSISNNNYTPSVLFCTDDLSTRYKYGQRVLQKEIIEAVGCTDAFEMNVNPARTNPDYLILPSDEAVELATTSKDLRSLTWANTTCVLEGNVYKFPSMKGCLSGVSSLERYLLGLQWLASIIEPAMPQFDFKKKKQEYIDVFYHSSSTKSAQSRSV